MHCARQEKNFYCVEIVNRSLFKKFSRSNVGNIWGTTHPRNYHPVPRLFMKLQHEIIPSLLRCVKPSLESRISLNPFRSEIRFFVFQWQKSPIAVLAMVWLGARFQNCAFFVPASTWTRFAAVSWSARDHESGCQNISIWLRNRYNLAGHIYTRFVSHMFESEFTTFT